MKKAFLIISFLLFTICSLAHKPIAIYKKFGNIKTVVFTNYKNYGETKNVEIFGKLAKELCHKLQYNDSINIEFVLDDSYYYYPKLLIVESGDVLTDRLSIENIDFIKEKQELKYSKKNVKFAICLRVLNETFDINKHLKILEYCILNKIENSLNKISFERINHDDVKEIKEVSYYGLTKSKIETILNKPNSIILNETLNSKVVFTDSDSPVVGTYLNGSYDFTINNISYKTSALIYLIELNSGMFVFDSHDSFVYLDKEIDTIKHIKIETVGRGPYYSSTFNHFDTSSPIVNGNILLFRNFSREWKIFSSEKNEIVNSNK